MRITICTHSIQKKMFQLLLLITSLVILQNSLFGQTSILGLEFDQYVKNTIQEWNAPGVIISVVKDNQHIFTKGYGTCKYDENLLPNENTLVTVASLTKAFTAAAIAILVDENELSWNDPVKKYIPEFHFVNSFISENTTLRDLLMHRAGLPSTKFGGGNNPQYNVNDLLKALKGHNTSSGFREHVNYSDINYALTGEVVFRVSGMEWPTFLTEHIFKPLNMSSTFATPSLLKKKYGDPNKLDNIFIRASRKDHKIVSDGFFGFDFLFAPASSIITTGIDISKWMIMQLQKGNYHGKQIISPESILEMHNPQIIEDINWAKSQNVWWKDKRDHFHPLIAYGLGWWIYDYQGRRVVEHYGGAAGSSVLALVNEQHLGIFITTNAVFPNWEGHKMIDALKLKIMDAYFDLPETDWSGQFLE
ncbi:hypothetical protein BVY01_04460 [bacterium I07]|nr:hypothetical protein BVY01_04460 [bacterium I07]